MVVLAQIKLTTRVFILNRLVIVLVYSIYLFACQHLYLTKFVSSRVLQNSRLPVSPDLPLGEAREAQHFTKAEWGQP